MTLARNNKSGAPLFSSWLLLVWAATTSMHSWSPGGGVCWGKVVWEGPIELPVIAAAMANVDNGKIVMWSGAYLADSSYRHNLDQKTWTTVWDPAAPNDAVATLVETSGHDML
jgi:hypothetical protein